PVEETARWSDERTTGAILVVAGLLPDEHDRRPVVTLAEHGLRRTLPEVARLAIGGGLPELVDGGLIPPRLSGCARAARAHDRPSVVAFRLPGGALGLGP